MGTGIQLPMPMNLPLLINDSRSTARAAIAKVLEGSLDTDHQLDTLSKYFRIKVWFDKPLFFKVVRHWKIIEKGAEDGREWTKREHISGVTTDCHIFHFIQACSGGLSYTTCKRRFRSRVGYHFPIENAIRWEPLIDKRWVAKKAA